MGYDQSARRINKHRDYPCTKDGECVVVLLDVQLLCFVSYFLVFCFVYYFSVVYCCSLVLYLIKRNVYPCSVKRVAIVFFLANPNTCECYPRYCIKEIKKPICSVFIFPHMLHQNKLNCDWVAM